MGDVCFLVMTRTWGGSLSTCQEVQLPKNIVAGIEAHGATKCLLEGEQGGALCDIAHCAARGAVVDGLVLYSSQGEVPEV